MPDTNINPSTITVGPGTLTLGEPSSTVSLSNQVTSLTITPSAKTDDPIPVLSGGQATGARSVSYTAKGTFLQDLGAKESVTEWTWQHDGETVPFTYAPSNAAGKTITGTLTVDATDIGGDVGSKPTADFEWTIQGKPTISSPTQ